MRPAFLIFACERSGSTLLSALLSQHSQLYVLNDTHMFRVYNRLVAGTVGWGSRKIVHRALRTVRTSMWSEAARLPPPTTPVDAQMVTRYYKHLIAWHRREAGNAFDVRLDPQPLLATAGSQAVTLEDLFSCVVEQLLPSDQPRTALVGEKTPSQAFLRPWIRRCYPEAAEIVLVRDPMTNVAAIYRRYARSLRVAVNVYLSYWAVLRPHEPRGRMIVRYEDLISEPATVLASVMRHLGVDEEHVRESFRYDRAAYIGATIDPLRDSRLRQTLDPDERKAVIRRCGPVVKDLYPQLANV